MGMNPDRKMPDTIYHEEMLTQSLDNVSIKHAKLLARRVRKIINLLLPYLSAKEPNNS
jgi:hypothetical protein